MAVITPPGSPRTSPSILLSTSPLPNPSVSAIAQRTLGEAETQPNDSRSPTYDLPDFENLVSSLEIILDNFPKSVNEFKLLLQNGIFDLSFKTINDALTHSQWSAEQKNKITSDLERVTKKLDQAKNQSKDPVVEEVQANSIFTQIKTHKVFCCTIAVAIVGLGLGIGIQSLIAQAEAVIRFELETFY